VKWPRRAFEIGSLVHKLVLPILHVRLAAVGLPSDYEIPAPRGSKRKWSDADGFIDLALFTPDPDPRKPGNDIANLYELKPNHPEQFQDYISEVDHYAEHFPKAYRPTRPSTLSRGRFISKARIGVSLYPLYRIQPLLFEPIVIEAIAFSVVIRFWPPPGVDGLIVYEWSVVPKRRGAEGIRERQMRSVISRMQVSPEFVYRTNQRNVGLVPGVAATAAALVILLGGEVLMTVAAAEALVVGVGVGTLTVEITAAAGTAGVAAGAGAGATTLTLVRLAEFAVPAANDIAQLAAGIVIALGGSLVAKPSDTQ
jgi:hypothetical protein